MTIRRDVPPTLSAQRDGVRPRSPSEVLEPGRAPPRPKGVKQAKPRNKKVSGVVRLFSGLLTLSLASLAIFAGAALLLRYETDKPGPLEVTHPVVIPKGTSRNEMAERLVKEGVIKSAWTFVLSSHLNERFGAHKGETLKYGDYEFKMGASVQDVLDIIFEGKSVQAKLTFPEGLTSQNIIDRIKADQNLSGDLAEVPVEGALYPDTYRFSRGMARQELVTQMLAKQKEVLAAEWEKRQEGLPFTTPEQALVLASIVEKETGKSDERERVAAVFVNRLKKNMRLESDPTVLYGLFGGAVQWGKPILQSELEAKNPHNTYEIKGLPPSPICNPGRASLAAVLNPAKTEEIYFVADGKGGHVFTSTLKDHNAAVAKWRKVEKEIRSSEKEARAKEEAEAKAAEAAAAATAAKAAGAATAGIKTGTTQQPGQRAVIKTVPPPADPNAIPSPPAEQSPKTAAAPASPVVKTVPSPGAPPVIPVPAPAAGSPVKTVPTAGQPAATSPKPVAAAASPVKTVQQPAATAVPPAPAPATAEPAAPAPAADATASAPNASTIPLPVRKPKKTN